VRSACQQAGLIVVATRGQHRGAHLEPEADEDVHIKTVYVARRDPTATLDSPTEGGMT